ncbi:O-antigen ligase family protein [Halomonas sp. H10-59]|uniref:O-antigen ligase family protein n=1 Tax=Halomonas sp. H10-59 TaxID=2950874 RepID=A0AAU7KZN9_9GAMM
MLDFPRSWYCPKKLYNIGVFLLFLYAFFGILWHEVGGKAGTLMAVIGLVALIKYAKEIRGSYVLLLFLSAIVLQSASWLSGYIHHPEWVSEMPQIDRLGKLFIFISVAWWLGGSTKYTLTVWLVSFLGFLTASVWHPGIEEWIRGINGERVGFGIRNNQHGSMLFGTCLIGWVVFSTRICNFGEKGCVLRFSIWLIVFVICATAVIIGQTRAVWLALVLSALSSIVVFFVYCISYKNVSIWRSFIWLSFALIFVFIVAFIFRDLFISRLSDESWIVKQVMDGNVSSIPATSIGTRLHSWIAALEWFKDRPLLGWGGQARGLVIDHSPNLPDFIKENYGHLHNFTIEVVVAYGVLGFLLMMLLALWMVYAVWCSWKAGIMPNDMALFLVTFFVYWAVVNQFESYNSFSTGVYVHNVILGGVVTHYWKYKYGGVPLKHC